MDDKEKVVWTLERMFGLDFRAMSVREGIEWALLYFGHLKSSRLLDVYKEKCFVCTFGGQRATYDMAFALILLGVPMGTHKTFTLTREYFGATASRCGKTSKAPDPDWPRFIEEIVRLTEGGEEK